MAAPRRTGKSTFLREDLVPEMRLRGWEPLYVDLWSDRTRDPADLIVCAVRDALARHDGTVLNAGKSVDLDQANAPGAIPLDLSTIDQAGGATLADALESLHKRAESALRCW